MTWPVTRLKNVADIRISSVDKKTVSGEQQVRLCNYVDVYKSQQIATDMDLMVATATVDQVRTFRVRVGDTLITKDSETSDDIAVAAYIADATPDMVCGYHLAMIRPDKHVHPKYLYWTLASVTFRSQMSSFATGVTRFGLRQDVIGGGEISLPPLEEQRRIADFLDVETAQIDSLLSARKAQLELLRQRRVSALARCVSVADEDAHKHPVVGRVAREWHIIPLRRVVDRIDVGVVINPSTHFVDDGVPFIHGFNVRSGWINPTGMKYMSEQSNAALSRSRLRSGDVLLVRAGAPGRAAVVPTEFDGANCASVLILRTGRDVLPEYLAAFINSPAGQGQVRVAQYGAAQYVISAGQALSFLVPVPPMREQERRVRQLNADDNSMSELTMKIEQQTDLLAERRQALITAAVTGQFDVASASGRSVPRGWHESGASGGGVRGCDRRGDGGHRVA